MCIYAFFLCYGQISAKSYTYTYIEQHKQYCPRIRTGKQKITTKELPRGSKKILQT